MLEAAVWDMPVLFGPNNTRFNEAQGLKAVCGGFDFADRAGFEKAILPLRTDETYRATCGKKAGKFVEGMTGATRTIMASIQA